MVARSRTVIIDADQYARLKPYLEIKGLPLAAAVREALEVHLECTVISRMETIQARLNKA